MGQKHKGVRDIFVNVLRDTGYFDQFEGYGDTMLSGFGDICHFSFRDVGYFSKYLKGYGILGPPPPPPLIVFSCMS